MKFWKKGLLLVLALALTVVLAACGGETPDTVDTTPADGHVHDYAERVIEPTCTEGGFTVYTCNVCGDKYTGNKVPSTGECVYESRQMLPSEKTAVYGIDAAYFEAEICRYCGKGDYHTAVIAYLGFDGEPEAPSGYTPSENYLLALETFDECIEALKLEGEEAEARRAAWKKMLDFIDQQQFLDTWNNASGVRGATLVDGALVGDWQFFIADNNNLFSELCPYESFSVSFDIAVNGNLKKGSNNDGYAAIFGAGGGNAEGGSNSMWRNPWRLCLDIDAEADGSHELVCAYWTYTSSGSSTRFVEPTGFYVEKGKTYSYRMDFNTKVESDDPYPTFRLYVKEAGAEEYVDLGTYFYCPRPETSSFKFFDPNCADGNVVDNFKIFVDLTAE